MKGLLVLVLVCSVNTLQAQTADECLMKINRIIENDRFQWLIQTDMSAPVISTKNDSIFIYDAFFSSTVVIPIHQIMAICYYPDNVIHSKDVVFYTHGKNVKYIEEDTIGYYGREFIWLTHKDSAMALVKEFGKWIRQLGYKPPPTTCAMLKSDLEDCKYWGTIHNRNTGDTIYVWGSPKKISGRFRVFWPNGKLRSEYNLKNGLSNGLQTTYYENGQMSWQKSYQNGIEHGPMTQWDEQGNVTGREEYENGFLKVITE